MVGAWCGTPTSALGSAYFLLYSQVSLLKEITRYVSQVRETLGTSPLQLKSVLLLTPGTSQCGDNKQDTL